MVGILPKTHKIGKNNTKKYYWNYGKIGRWKWIVLLIVLAYKSISLQKYISL
jgi:hypothetical protein